MKIATTNFSPSQGTVGLWIKPAAFPSNTHYAFGHTTVPAYANRIQLYFDGSAGYLNTGFGDSNTKALKIHQLRTNTWDHVALTWNSGKYAVYVNGTQKATGSYSGFTSINSDAHIGGVGNDSDPHSWSGAIDEVKLWNRALTAIEVQNEMNSNEASPVAPTNLAVGTQ